MHDGKTARVARSILSKVDDIYRRHPTMKFNLNKMQRDLAGIMERMKDELKVLNDDEANLVTVSLINNIHQQVDEILLADFPEADGDSSEEEE